MENNFEKEEKITPQKVGPLFPSTEIKPPPPPSVKKVLVDEITNTVINQLPPELSDMLKAARLANNPVPAQSAIPTANEKVSEKNNYISEPAKKTSSKIEQLENKKKVVTEDITNSVINELPPELSEMLKAARKMNNPEPKQLPPKEPKKPDDKTIHETGMFLGLEVTKSSQNDVIEAMKTISNINITNPRESIFKYDNLGIVFYFGEGGVLQEMTFSYPFAGVTSKGLRIEDSIYRAIEIYGNPKMKTAAGAIWAKFAVFLKGDKVMTIRLRAD